MKTTFLLTLWNLLFTALLFSNITIHGNLVDPDGEGVPNVEILLRVVWDQNDAEEHTLVTGIDGEFRMEFNRSPDSRALVFLKYINCDGDIIQVEDRILRIEDTLYLRLQYCAKDDDDEPCGVSVTLAQNNDGERILIASGSGAEPFEFLWSDSTTGETFVLPESGEFCVTLTDSDGCTAQLCDLITDSSGCRARIIRLPSNGSTVRNQLAVQYQPESDVVNILWSTGDTSQYIQANQPGRYCVKVTFSDGCVAETCLWIGSADTSGGRDCLEASISVYYSIDLSYADLTVEFEPAQNLEFLWNTGETTSEISVTESGLYTVIITNLDQNCRVIRFVFVQLERCEVRIEVRQTTSGWILTAITPFGSSTPISYLWSTGETTQSILVNDPDLNYCVVIRTSNCRNRACVVPSNILIGGIQSSKIDQNDNNITDTYAGDESGLKTFYSNSTNLESRLVVFPNPASDVINFSSNIEWQPEAILSITDMQGRTIKQSPLEHRISKGVTSKFNISDLKQGLYIITLSDGIQVAQTRLIIH